MPHARARPPTTPGAEETTADQRLGAYAAIPSILRAMGADPDAVLATAGLDASALDHPEKRIPYAALGRLLAAAAEYTACPHFGLICGAQWRLCDLGLAGEIARNCATVGDALRALVVHQRLNSSGGVAYLLDHGETTDFGYAIYHGGFRGAAHVYTATLAGGATFLRELCTSPSAVQAVMLPFRAPSRLTPYRHYFGAPVRFGADRAAIRLASAWLARPVPRAKVALRSALEADACRQGQGELLDRVVRALRVLLLEGRHSGDGVAQLLGLHRRTLNRRLKALGTSYQELLDNVRFEAARQLLRDGDMPIEEIAASLGYSGLSAFQRRFRRWAGSPPRRWRADERIAKGAAAVAASAPPIVS